MYAAGILPVRVLGSHEPQDVTEPHIFGMYCPLCRDVLAQGLQGRYEYLDGIMIAQSCLHMRQAFASWKIHVPINYSYYMCHPMHVQSPAAKPYLSKARLVLKDMIDLLKDIKTLEEKITELTREEKQLLKTEKKIA